MNGKSIKPLLAAAVAAGAMVSLADTWGKYVPVFNRGDSETYVNTIANSNAEEFLRRNAPAFECPDGDIERTYHFRWWTFRKHLKSTEDGWVVTEFLPPVGWARKHNTISCALGHHCREGRWLRDPKYVSDYLKFMLTQGTVSGYGAYINWPASSLAALEENTGDGELAKQLLAPLAKHYREWEKGWLVGAWPLKGKFRIGLDGCGLFGMSANYEGSEFSLSGNGYRPLLNSCMVSEARCIAAIAASAGDSELEREFSLKAAKLEKKVLENLWSDERRFFLTMARGGAVSKTRELNGYAPWYFGLNVKGKGDAFDQLLDEGGFAAPWGLTFPERRDAGFKIDYDGHCCLWNGPVWPYSTSITLTALAKAIADGDSGSVGAAGYFKLLKQYAASHVIKLEDGRSLPWIDENQNPFDGDWVARTKLLRQGDKIVDRGKDYNHSTFCDLVLSGLVGLSSPAAGTISVRPLVPPSWNWFRLSKAPCAGALVDVVYDRDGSRMGGRAGFEVFADGKSVYYSPELPKLAVFKR